MDQKTWQLAPLSLDFSTDEVHLWRARIDAHADPRPDVLSVLSSDERARAAAIPSQPRRRTFVVGRALLRQVLARYLRTPATSLEFQQAAHGKPELSPGWRGSGVEFNLSHSGAMILIAVALGREVGVDVENIRVDFDHRRIVERFFAPEERAEYAALAPERQREAFWRAWVRKEAFLKATGGGLSTLALDRFAVSLAPDRPAELLSVADAPGQAAAWRLQDVEPGHGYVGAVAVSGHGWRPVYWRWVD